VESVIHSGCKLIATAHGNSLEDVLGQPFFQKLMKEKLFERYIFLGKNGQAGIVEGVFDGEGNPCRNCWESS
jgi:stage III sporulation protein AA